MLATERNEFRQPDLEESIKLLNKPLIFDGRNQYDRKRMKNWALSITRLGWRDKNETKGFNP